MKGHLQNMGGFIMFLVLCFGAQVAGSLLTLPTIRSGWYAVLEKPFFNPPAWVFGPVWTILYLTMAIAAWMVWKQGLEVAFVKPALVIFIAQLAFNVLWSALFFAMRRPGLALFEIFLLWLLILATLLVFYRVSRPAAWILLPYLVWTSYAVLLNGAIWWLNRSSLGNNGAVW